MLSQLKQVIEPKKRALMSAYSVIVSGTDLEIYSRWDDIVIRFGNFIQTHFADELRRDTIA